MLKVGLIIDDDNLLDATQDWLTRSLDAAYYRVEGLIVVESDVPPRSRIGAALRLIRQRRYRELSERVLMSGTRVVENRYLRNKRPAGLDLDEFLAAVASPNHVRVIRVKPDESAKGYVLRLSLIHI